MRKVIGILSLLLVISFTSNAQQNNKRGERKAQLSPEQMATLQIKKMDLQLDLNDSQEKAIYKLIEAQSIEREKAREKFSSKREKGEKLTSEERFEQQNARLDKQLEHKAAMKKILSQEQFSKWEENAKDKMKSRKKRIAKTKNSGENRQGFKTENQQKRPYKNKS